jgi:hypothetical protein
LSNHVAQKLELVKLQPAGAIRGADDPRPAFAKLIHGFKASEVNQSTAAQPSAKKVLIWQEESLTGSELDSFPGL